MTTAEPITAAWAGLDDLPVAAAEMHSAQEWRDLLATATDVLWGLTARRWRGVELTESATLRAADPRPSSGSWLYHPSWGRCSCYVSSGWTSDGGLPVWGHASRHAGPLAIRLPRPDVVAVTAVTVDDVAFTGYRLDGHWLTRVDGGAWAVCHDRTTVIYRYGRLAPRGGRAAVVELAVELGRASAEHPDRPCSLPRRLTSATRQGLSFAVLDPLDYLDKGLTGLPSVDLWVRATNPKGRAQAATCWSPDLATARRTS